jgi:hypothetical protein
MKKVHFEIGTKKIFILVYFNEETDLSELGEVVFAAERALPEVLLSLAAGRSLVQLLLLRPHVVEPENTHNYS